MKYLYQCKDCHVHPIVVDKPMSKSSETELCTCGAVMTRVFSSVATITGDGHKSAKS